MFASVLLCCNNSSISVRVRPNVTACERASEFPSAKKWSWPRSTPRELEPTDSPLDASCICIAVCADTVTNLMLVSGCAVSALILCRRGHQTCISFEFCAVVAIVVVNMPFLLTKPNAHSPLPSWFVISVGSSSVLVYEWKCSGGLKAFSKCSKIPVRSTVQAKGGINCACSCWEVLFTC